MTTSPIKKKPHVYGLTPTSRLYGFFLVATGTALFSCKAVFIKLAYRHGAHPDVLMALRMAFSLPFYLIIGIQAQRKFNQPISPRTILFTLIFGLFGYYIASAFDLYGLQYISASLERLLLYSYPTIVMIMSVVFLGAVIKGRFIACIALIYTGLLIVFIKDTSLDNQRLINTVFGQMPTLYFGGLLVMISAFSFSIYLIGSELMMRTLPSRLFTAYAMLAACVAIGIHFLIQQPFDLLFQQSPVIYGIGLILAFFCTVLPSFMLSAGIQAVGASTAGAVGSMGPIATLILGNLLLDEQVTHIQMFGFAIVIGGVLLLGRLQLQCS